MSQHPSTSPDPSSLGASDRADADAADTYPGSSDESYTAKSIEGERGLTGSAERSGSDGGDPGSSSTVDAAKEQGQQVGQQAVEGGQKVASVAVDQAKSVASEAAGQARDLMSEAKSQLSDQAATQQGNLATWLHSLADELHTLTDKGTDTDKDTTGDPANADRPAAQTAGMVTDFTSRTSGQVKRAADWLDKHDPADLLEEATRFARQRPGAFLAAAAVAGLVAGRLTRGLKADTSGVSTTGEQDRSAVPPTGVGAGAGSTFGEPTPGSAGAAGPVDISAAPESVWSDSGGSVVSTDRVDAEDPWVADGDSGLRSDVLGDPADGESLRGGEDRR